MIALLDGEMRVCDRAGTTGLSESAVSHGLRFPRAHHVVEVRRSGRMAYYSLADAEVRLLPRLQGANVGHGLGAPSQHGPPATG